MSDRHVKYDVLTAFPYGKKYVCDSAYLHSAEEIWPQQQWKTQLST